jgi:hypothetical protein
MDMSRSITLFKNINTDTLQEESNRICRSWSRGHVRTIIDCEIVERARIERCKKRGLIV